jgi:hypothetical protein
MRLVAILVAGLAMSAPCMQAGAQTVTIDSSRTRTACITNTSEPGSRVAGLFVFDSLRDRLIVYGGVLNSCDPSVDRTDADPRTYARAGDRWSIVASQGPRSRDEVSYGYDPRDGSIVMFGGRGQSAERDARGMLARVPFSDTWRFDGTRWTLVDTLAPPMRVGAQGAFDVARGRFVLFGGVQGTVTGRDAVYNTDTWEWDGRRWSRFDVPSPPGRTGHMVAYDAHARMVIVHGGVRSADGGVALTDTWGWTGERWRLLTMEGPRARFVAAATALDSGIVLFGPGARDAPASTWQWNGRSWQVIATGGPSPRTFNHMTTDHARKRIFMMGGMAASGLPRDLWILDAQHRWTQVY